MKGLDGYRAPLAGLFAYVGGVRSVLALLAGKQHQPGHGGAGGRPLGTRSTGIMVAPQLVQTKPPQCRPRTLDAALRLHPSSLP